MATQGQPHRFMELIRPGTRFDFVGRQHQWFRLAVAAVVLSLLALPVNALISSRGHVLNWNVDFRGGSEVVVDLARPVAAQDIRAALDNAGYEGVEVVALGSASGHEATRYQLRFGSISPLAKPDAAALRTTLEGRRGHGLAAFEWSEGGDRVSLRFDQPAEPAQVEAIFREAGVKPVSIVPVATQKEQTSARAYEVALISLGSEIRAHVDERLGAGTVSNVPTVASVGAKAGAQLRTDALKALVAAMLLIMVYVAFRFDMRYAPATLVALVHDAVVMVGVLAISFREVSLTTVAALLTIVGFSMNDKVVVFDRIRELAARTRGGDFRQAVNQALNQTLSRTIITNSTVFFVTLAMNVFATGIIREFAFAMNVGVVLATFSTIFVATPVVIWLNDRFVAAQRKGGRRVTRRSDDTEPALEP